VSVARVGIALKIHEIICGFFGRNWKFLGFLQYIGLYPLFIQLLYTFISVFVFALCLEKVDKLSCC